ncbi:MAG: ribbon-helix-helix protein, CopG family [Hyphomicrobium sp.]
MRRGILITLRLTEEQVAQVRDQARLEDTTVSKVIRDAIVRYLGPTLPRSDDTPNPNRNYLRG